jgi:hypothetical protein
MIHARRSDLGAIALAVAVFVGIAVVSCSGGAASPVATQSNVQDERQATVNARPLALIIGDSYTAGESSAEMSYACRAAVEIGWLCALSAVGGTGYISGGAANRWTDPHIGKTLSFSERIPHLSAKYDPALVIMDGGRNDEFAPRNYVFDETVSTIGEVRRAWPAATVIFIQPRLLAKPGDNLGYDDEFMVRLRSEPEAQGVIFIDPLASFSNTDTSTLLAADGIHPNRQGEEHMTTALVDALVSNHVGSSS